jgi:hypothetical protein
VSDTNTIKVELNNKRNRRKYSDTWRLNNILLHDQWVTEERKEKMKKLLEFNKHNLSEPMGTQQRQC